MQNEHSRLVKSLKKSSTEIMEEMTPIKADLLHMVLGLAGEVGELVDAVKKAVFYNKCLDVDNTIEELGDIEFYLEGFRQTVYLQRESIIQHNIDKLNKRYSSGSFSNQQAEKRADKGEQQ